VGEENQDNNNTQQLEASTNQNNEEKEEKSLKYEFRVVCYCWEVSRDTERIVKRNKNPQK
jgi:hypothetical protein